MSQLKATVTLLLSGAQGYEHMSYWKTNHQKKGEFIEFNLSSSALAITWYIWTNCDQFCKVINLKCRTLEVGVRVSVNPSVCIYIYIYIYIYIHGSCDWIFFTFDAWNERNQTFVEEQNKDMRRYCPSKNKEATMCTPFFPASYSLRD